MAAATHEVDDILAGISALNSRYQRCPVAAALKLIAPQAAAAFEEALRADREKYQHQAIARMLGQLADKRLSRESVAKHRLTIAGQTGGCSCGR